MTGVRCPDDVAAAMGRLHAAANVCDQLGGTALPEPSIAN